MKLSELSKGQQAIITKVLAQEPVKSRLFSFGLVKGAVITVKDYTLTKETIDCLVGDTDVALRTEEAQTVEVSL